MEILRTPDDRFADLPDFAYEPHYVEVDLPEVGPARLARIDEGDGHPVVLVHGEPTWSFLYRHVIPPLLDAGLRVVAPDHPGLGRSDKPADRDWFTYDRMVEAFDAHLDAAGIDEPCTLVVHDWGGPIGLRWAVEHPQRVARLVILDTGLFAPGGTPSDAWLAFRGFVAKADELPIGQLVQGGAATTLPDDVVAAYEAPFDRPEAQAGAIALPLLVPLSEDDPGAAEMWRTNQALTSFEAPTLVLWGADDEILPPSIGRRYAETIPGSVGMETFHPASHFLQEDAGTAIGQRIAAFVTA